MAAATTVTTMAENGGDSGNIDAATWVQQCKCNNQPLSTSIRGVMRRWEEEET